MPAFRTHLPGMDLVKTELTRFRTAAETTLLLGGLGVLLSIIGILAFGLEGVIFGPVGLAAVAIVQVGRIDWLLRLHRVRPVHPASRQGRLFRALMQRSGLSGVGLYVTPAAALNAFAAADGTKAAVVVTAPILERFPEDELAGILGHELTHIRNDDVRVMGAASTLARMVTHTGVIAVLAAILGPLFGAPRAEPVGTMLAALSVAVLATWMTARLSRTREFAADLGAATLLGSPVPLARAPVRLDRYARWLTPPWLRPLTRRSLHDSHPATGERLERLGSYVA